MKKIRNNLLPVLMILVAFLWECLQLFSHRLGLPEMPYTHNWLFWVSGLSGILRLVTNRRKIAGSERIDEDSFRKKYRIEIGILLLTALSLSMLINSGYYWDDAVNSTQYLAQKYDSVPLAADLWTFIRSYLELGRINILSAYYYFFFYIENVHVYKALTILMILADQLIFRSLLMEMGLSKKYARTGMLLLPLFLQTRVYQDPVSGFYGLMQVLTAEMMLTALFLLRYLRNSKKRDLFLSLLMFTFGLLTYEVCFPFLAMVCLLILVWEKHLGRAIVKSLPFVGITILALAAVAYVRSLPSFRPYVGVAFSLKPERILRAFKNQLVAAFPLSFYTAGHEGSVMGHIYAAPELMNYSLKKFLCDVSGYDILLLLLGLGLITALKRTASAGDKGDEANRFLAAAGFCFWILPTFTMALSDRYQGQLLPGLGYLPVYMQYFGVVMLVLWVFRWSVKPVKGNLRQGLIVSEISAFAVILLLNLQNNRAVTQVMNHVFYYPRQAGESALRGGILDFLPEDAIVLADNSEDYLWEANWVSSGLYDEFYKIYSRHPKHVTGRKQLRTMVDTAIDDGAEVNEDGWMHIRPNNLYVISYDGDSESGLAKVGHVTEMKVNQKNLKTDRIITDDVIYFISGDHVDDYGVGVTDAGGDFIQVLRKEHYMIRRTDEGILCQMDPDKEYYFRSLIIN